MKTRDWGEQQRRCRHLETEVRPRGLAHGEYCRDCGKWIRLVRLGVENQETPAQNASDDEPRGTEDAPPLFRRDS